MTTLSAGWAETTLGELTTPVIKRPPSGSAGDTFTYIDLSSVDQHSKQVTDPTVMAVETAPSRARQVVAATDVLVSTVRPNLNGVAMVPAELDGAIASTGFTVLRSKSGELDARYLFHWVRGPRFVSSMVRLSTGASYPAVTDRIVKESPIPLPPLEEQRRIATILDKADGLRAKRRAALEQLDALTQAIFLDMFGEPARNVRGWPVVQIGDVTSSATYGTAQKASREGAVPVLRMGNLTAAGAIDTTDLKFLDHAEEKYLLRPGDVLFNRTNSPDLVGKTAVFRLPGEWAYAGYLVRVRLNEEAAPDYLGTFMNLPTTKQRLRSICKSIVGQANINAKELQRIPIPLPPRSLQDDYARRLEAVERAKCRASHGERCLDGLFSSLQSRAFRGEL